MDMRINSKAYGTEYANVEYRHIYNKKLKVENKAIILYIRPMNIELYKTDKYLGLTITFFGKGFTCGLGAVNV